MEIYSFIYPVKPYTDNHPITLSYSMQRGWGNGYVALPPEHPYHGIGYDFIDVDVHGGLTYAQEAHTFKDRPKKIPDDYWILGFDTAHGDDNPKDQDELFVKLQTEYLKKQLLDMSKHKIVDTKLYAKCPDCSELNIITPPTYSSNYVGETVCNSCNTTFHYYYEET